MITLKPQHQTNSIAQLIDAKYSLNYLKSEIVPRFSEMELFEQKEYQSIISDNEKTIKNLSIYIMENEADFNLILGQYNLSCPVFLCVLNNYKKFN